MSRHNDDFVTGTGVEAGSGGRASALDEKTQAAWERTWLLRQKQTRKVPEGVEDVAVRVSANGTVTSFRPQHCIVTRADEDRVRPFFERVDAVARDERGDERGSVLYELPPDVDVLAFVDRVRKAASRDGQAPPELGPNHVFAAQPHMKWGPGGEPEPDAGDVEIPEQCAGPGEGVTIGVLDTGMWSRWPAHHAALKSRVEFVDVTEQTKIDFDPLVAGGPLVLDAGHGTFIAGIIAQRAPGARVDPEATLDKLGMVDEYQVGLDLPDVAEAQILSMSFAGYTHRDRPPVELGRLLEELPADVEVVACAGNQGSTRPAWPAAFARVTAVAAVGRDHRPAFFTNRGWWVDACTYGVLERSTYVTGEYPRADGSTAIFEEPVARWSGTSFAAPRYAAAVAAAMTEHGFATARAASGHLLATGKPMGAGLGVFVP